MPVQFCDALHSGDQEVPLPGALLIHADKHHPTMGCLITAHDVREGEDGVRRLLAGHPIDRELARGIASAILGNGVTRTLLPASVLSWDGIRLMWWTPSRRRRIWFDPRERPGLEDVSRQEVTQPALLWVAEARALFVYALAGNQRPEAGTFIFQAPYLNVYPNGWCCFHSVQLPHLQPERIPEWETAFHDSVGTKVWAQQLTLFPGGHDALWRAMRPEFPWADDSYERFPAEALVPTGLTVLDALNQEWRTSYPEAAPAEEVVPLEGLP
jgi:PRTRC genetic system protein B